MGDQILDAGLRLHELHRNTIAKLFLCHGTPCNADLIFSVQELLAKGYHRVDLVGEKLQGLSWRFEPRNLSAYASSIRANAI